MTVQENNLGSDKKFCRDMTGRLRRNTLEVILRVAKPLAICCLCLNGVVYLAGLALGSEDLGGAISQHYH
jgi:hypothetical protein